MALDLALASQFPPLEIDRRLPAMHFVAPGREYVDLLLKVERLLLGIVMPLRAVSDIQSSS